MVWKALIHYPILTRLVQPNKTGDMHTTSWFFKNWVLSIFTDQYLGVEHNVSWLLIIHGICNLLERCIKILPNLNLVDTETSSIRWIDCKRLKKLDMRLDFCFLTALVAVKICAGVAFRNEDGGRSLWQREILCLLYSAVWWCGNVVL